MVLTRRDSALARGRLRMAPAWLLLLLLLLFLSGPILLDVGLALMDSGNETLRFRLLPLLLHTLLLGVLLSARARLRSALWLLMPLAAIAPLEFFYLLQFRLPSGLHVYGVVADTDWQEASSWMGPWLWPFAAAMVLLLVMLAWVVRQIQHGDLRWNPRLRRLVLGGSTALLLLLAGIEWATLEVESKMQRPANEYLAHSLAVSDPGLLSQLERSFPWGLPLRWQRFREHQQALSAHREAAARHDFHVRWRDAQDATQAQVVVMVIGETGRPDRWQLFGAPRETTPKLSARRGIVSFEDAVSGASATREAVPLMLTRRPPAQMLAPPNEASVVTAFKQAGFRTYWLSTQGAAGAHETPISVLAREADEQHFVNAVDYRGAGALDGELLPLVQKILDKGEARQFIVLHTLGSHLHYAHRYPPSFERFKPALALRDKPDIWRPVQVEEMRNAYDNSVLYTDHVIDAVIGMLDHAQRRSSLMYAADHGETLYDGDCKRAGHGFAAAVNYRVPMFVWLSDRWQLDKPDGRRQLERLRSEPVSALAVFPTLTGLAGFDIAAPHAHGDLGAAERRPAPRLVTHFGDFDKDLLGKQCDSRPASSSQR
ncbi:sulfatase-like hydrolase/transferase [Pelomonas sp. V22]|uniref:phosphoethanolamine transferase n=1 Tax=Pelomonas sp. V22 TaxID=2822139 RepID=UPI0024A95686|nr:phosphoethanolamine transferase [Pelomonas sp. V22]MDI4634702.1 sulfatase-like hydrolase/transferase [Pelomonas sp. V22]